MAVARAIQNKLSVVGFSKERAIRVIISCTQTVSYAHNSLMDMYRKSVGFNTAVL